MPRPYHPRRELEGAIKNGHLDWAIVLAKEVAHDTGHPLDLETSLDLLVLVASQRPEEYSRWALKWLARWATETSSATIEQAAEFSGALADLPAEPTALKTVRDLLSA
jgi:hypothetical protein